MTEVTELTAPAGATPNTQEVLLNLGPQHPSTHGVLRLVLEMEAEIRRARRPAHRLSPPGHREAGRELHLHPDLPADRPARLSLPALQQPRLRAGGREAPRHRGAGAGAVHPRADGRAGAALRPPADHRRAADGPRRDDRAALRHARARDDHGPHGDDHRRAHAHLVLPGRRRARGPDRRAHRQDPGVLRDLPEPDPRLRAAARQEPGVPEAHARHRRDHARGRRSTSASAARTCAPRASTGISAATSPTRSTTGWTSTSSPATRATASPAGSAASTRCARA